MKKSLFPVQRVAKIVASWAATKCSFFTRLCVCVFFGEKIEKNCT